MTKKEYANLLISLLEMDRKSAWADVDRCTDLLTEEPYREGIAMGIEHAIDKIKASLFLTEDNK